MGKALQLGNFTGLAANYSRYRPGYADSVLRALTGRFDVPNCTVADVGAGTGIWTRMLAEAGFVGIQAIEPNADMRAAGIRTTTQFPVQWSSGSGENTGMEDGAFDLVTMASSFHWVDFEQGCREFARILRPNGSFLALWNPRLIEASPLLLEIENFLYTIAPHIERKSSGRSAFTETLTQRFEASDVFHDTLYLEGRHSVRQSIEEYLGVWRSVNDVRAQAGEQLFSEFMTYLQTRVDGLPHIETTYLTRAWCVTKR